MKLWKKVTALLLAGALALGLCACSLPTRDGGFADYDVSAYVKALLDSTYHEDNDALISLSGISQKAAQENNATTVANAAVRFCNRYGVSPSQDQLTQLENLMRSAFALTRYTVKEERKVEGGYYLEVDIAAITCFEGLQSEIDRLKTGAAEEATYANYNPPEDGAPQHTDANDLFVEKVLALCAQQLSNISYDVEAITVPVDVLQTDEGELKLNMDQIKTIDETVIRF